MTQYTRNILKVYNQATQSEIDHGMTWYADAKSDAQSMADKYELPLHIVVGVIAALSPTNRWERTRHGLFCPVHRMTLMLWLSYLTALRSRTSFGAS